MLVCAKHVVYFILVFVKSIVYVQYLTSGITENVGTHLWLKSTWGLDGRSQFWWSTDGDTYHPWGEYDLSWGYYRGDRIGLFCWNDQGEQGWIDVDYGRYTL